MPVLAREETALERVLALNQETNTTLVAPQIKHKEPFHVDFST